MPVMVLPVIYPVVFVTDGVTVTLWFNTVPLLAVGVPAVPVGIALIVTLPVIYFPCVASDCELVVGVTVCPAIVDN